MSRHGNSDSGSLLLFSCVENAQCAGKERSITMREN